MIKYTWVEIWNPTLNIDINTAKKRCETQDEGKIEFEKFCEHISSWETEFDGIIADTNFGNIRIPANIIVNSIIKFRYEEIQE